MMPDEMPTQGPDIADAMTGKGRIKMVKPSPEQEAYLNLIRGLTDTAVVMVLKLATCECEKKDSCKVFKQAQAIAGIIDKLQEMKPEGVKSVKARGKG